MFFKGAGRDQTFQVTDPLDDFRYALQDQKCESDRDQELGRPYDKAACVAGYFLVLYRNPGIRYRVVQDQQCRWHQEQQEAEQIDPDLCAFGKTADDDVNANVFVSAQSVRGRKQEDGSK